MENVYCSDVAMAEILISPAQHTATISLSQEWRKWNPSVLRSTIVHELMHCHINQINEMAEEHIEGLAPKSFSEVKRSMDYVNERVTDALAEMVSPYLTLPRTPVRQQSRTLSHTLSYSRTRNKNKKSEKRGGKGNASVKKRGGKRRGK